MTASTPASREHLQLLGVVHRPHVHLHPLVVGAGRRSAPTSTVVSVHDVGVHARCAVRSTAVTSTSSGGIAERQQPGREVGREFVHPVDDVASRTTTPAPGRPWPSGRRAGRRTSSVGVAGSLISMFTSRPRHTSSTSARIGTSGRGPDGAASGSAGAVGRRRRGGRPARRRRCGARRARPRRPPLDRQLATRERCSPAPAGWPPGARARASRSPWSRHWRDRAKFLVSPLRGRAWRN